MLPLNLVWGLLPFFLIQALPSRADTNRDDFSCLLHTKVSNSGYPQEYLPYSRNPVSYSLAKAEGLLFDGWAFAGYIFSHFADYLSPGTDYSSLEDELNSHRNAKALFVLLHALDHPPEMWSQYLKTLGSKSDIDIWVPNLPRWGNTSAQKVMKVLEKPLRKYLTQWPERRIVLIGSSNGARIGLELEIKLRNQHSHILLASIAGVFAGTERIWMRRIITDSDFYRECSYESDHSLLVMKQARERLAPTTNRKHLFYVADGDFFVVPLNASLLVMDHNEEYFYVKSTGHTSIVNKVKDDVLEKAFSWIQQQENSL